MLLSVIIPTCNRNDLLGLCLDLLHPAFQSIDKNEYEVIVSDDSKLQLAKDLVAKRYPWATWVEGPQTGPAANRNNGAKLARGAWLVFIDDDCLPDKEILNNYALAIRQFPAIKAFEGAIVPDDWNTLKKDMAECPVNTTGDFFWSANVCLEAGLFKKINGFDETYLLAAHEDQQMKSDIEDVVGKNIMFLKACIVVHPVRFATVRKKINIIPAGSKNFSLYAFKNRQKLNYQTIWKFTKDQYHVHLRRTFLFLLKGKFKSLLVSGCWVLYGVPMNIVNFYNQQKVNR